MLDKFLLLEIFHAIYVLARDLNLTNIYSNYQYKTDATIDSLEHHDRVDHRDTFRAG